MANPTTGKDGVFDSITIKFAGQDSFECLEQSMNPDTYCSYF
jgi:hypothetical protein